MIKIANWQFNCKAWICITEKALPCGRQRCNVSLYNISFNHWVIQFISINLPYRELNKWNWWVKPYTQVCCASENVVCILHVRNKAFCLFPTKFLFLSLSVDVYAHCHTNTLKSLGYLMDLRVHYIPNEMMEYMYTFNVPNMYPRSSHVICNTFADVPRWNEQPESRRSCNGGSKRRGSTHLEILVPLTQTSARKTTEHVYQM